MALQVAGQTIERVAIIEDDPAMRATYADELVDLGIDAVLKDGVYRDIRELVRGVPKEAEAAICDHHLRQRNYATFNGADLVDLFYRAEFPAVLCTRLEKATIDELRHHRRHIPALLNPSEVTPESLAQSLQQCIEEFTGTFVPSRRLWRTQVRIEDLEGDFVYVVVPAWDANQVVRLRRTELPDDIVSAIELEKRVHAHVNTGAEAQEDLFFTDWEPV